MHARAQRCDEIAVLDLSHVLAAYLEHTSCVSENKLLVENGRKQRVRALEKFTIDEKRTRDWRTFGAHGDYASRRGN